MHDMHLGRLTSTKGLAKGKKKNWKQDYLLVCEASSSTLQCKHFAVWVRCWKKWFLNTIIPGTHLHHADSGRKSHCRHWRCLPVSKTWSAGKPHCGQPRSDNTWEVLNHPHILSLDCTNLVKNETWLRAHLIGGEWLQRILREKQLLWR